MKEPPKKAPKDETELAQQRKFTYQKNKINQEKEIEEEIQRELEVSRLRRTQAEQEKDKRPVIYHHTRYIEKPRYLEENPITPYDRTATYDAVNRSVHQYQNIDDSYYVQQRPERVERVTERQYAPGVAEVDTRRSARLAGDITGRSYVNPNYQAAGEISNSRRTGEGYVSREPGTAPTRTLQVPQAEYQRATQGVGSGRGVSASPRRTGWEAEGRAQERYGGGSAGYAGGSAGFGGGSAGYGGGSAGYTGGGAGYAGGGEGYGAEGAGYGGGSTVYGGGGAGYGGTSAGYPGGASGYGAGSAGVGTGLASQDRYTAGVGGRGEGDFGVGSGGNRAAGRTTSAVREEAKTVGDKRGESPRSYHSNQRMNPDRRSGNLQDKNQLQRAAGVTRGRIDDSDDSDDDSEDI